MSTKKQITLNNIQRYSSKIVKNKLSRADIARRLPIGTANSSTAIYQMFCDLNPALCNNYSKKQISAGAIIDVIYRLGANECIYILNENNIGYVIYRNRADEDDVTIYGTRDNITDSIDHFKFHPQSVSSASLSIVIEPEMQVQQQKQSPCDIRARNFSDTLLALETNMRNQPTKPLIEKVREHLLRLRQQLEECKGASDTWRIDRVNEFKVTADRYKAWKDTGLCDITHAKMQMDIIRKILGETYTSTKKARIERLLADVKECRQVDIKRIVSMFHDWSAAGQAQQQQKRRVREQKEARQREARQKQADEEKQKDRRLLVSLADVFDRRADIMAFLADMKTAEDTEKYDDFLHKYSPIAGSFRGRSNPEFMLRYDAILKKQRQSAAQHGVLSATQRTRLLRVLGLNPTSSSADIKKAYRKLSLTEHPDKGGNADRFREITQSYKKLIS